MKLHKSSIYDTKQSIHYNFYSQVLIGAFHCFSEKVLALTKKRSYQQKVTGPAAVLPLPGVIYKSVEALAEFTLGRDPEKLDKFILPFLVEPMLSLLHQLLSIHGAFHLTPKLFHLLTASRIIYSVSRLSSIRIFYPASSIHLFTGNLSRLVLYH
jgi:hypothetical protein